MQSTVDIPIIANIPPIHIGASWRAFDLEFFSDEAKTIPLLLAGYPIKSQIYSEEMDKRYDVNVLFGINPNHLLFRLTSEETKLLPAGELQWDVFIERDGIRDPLAAGMIQALSRATIWSD